MSRNTCPLKVYSLSLGLLLPMSVTLPIGAVQPASSVPTQAEAVRRFVVIDNVCAWPNLTVLRDGMIMATIFNQPCHGRWEGDVECWGSRDGLSWLKYGTPAPHKPGENRMNVAAGLARNGSLVVLASGWNNRPKVGDAAAQVPNLAVADILPIWACRSGDGGRTWERNEVNVTLPNESDARMVPFGDIVALKDGTLGVCLYRVSQRKATNGSLFYVSKDDGRTWSFRGQIRGGISETAPVVLKDGRLLAAGRTYGDQHLELFESADYGATWKGSGSVTGPQQHPAHLVLLNDGRLLLSYGNRVKNRYGVEVKLSEDDGASWSDPVSVVSDLGTLDCGYPSSVQLPGGEILTAFYASEAPCHQRYHMGTAIWRLPPSRLTNTAKR